MGFSTKQNRALKRDVARDRIMTRQMNGRELSYIEGWHAIAEANRLFGFDGWDRETVEAKCVLGREMRGAFAAIYTAKVRITVRAGADRVVREGHGTGEGKGGSPGEAHDTALKAAETDATKRALATFGRPFGLGLYLRVPPARGSNASRRSSDHEQQSPSRFLSAEPARVEPAQPDQNAKPVANQEGSPRQLGKIDKSLLTFGEVPRRRNRNHLRFVATQPCLLCGRTPSDPHHLRFAQPRALGLKASDEFTVPLCRIHHRLLHQTSNEVAWWNDLEVDPLPVAKSLWDESRKRQAANNDKTPASMAHSGSTLEQTEHHDLAPVPDRT